MNLCAVFLLLIASLKSSKAKLNESEFKDVIKNKFEPRRQILCHAASLASWDHETDLNNKEKEERQLNLTLQSAEFQRQMWEKYFHDLNQDDYKDPHLKRQAKFLRILGDSVLNEEKLTRLNNVVNEMTSIYSKARVCPYEKQKCALNKEGYNLEPGITKAMSKSTNYKELLYYWKEWRDATGAKMRDLYKTYVDLSNESAEKNKFHNRAEMWLYDFESPSFIEDIDKLWNQIEPLYIQLHKYVGRKLKTLYGDELDISDGLIPAHVFGNMWAQQWDALNKIVRPYPQASKVDGDAALKTNRYTVLKLFETADEFYQSLGLIPNKMSYDPKKALIEKPKDGRDVVCHASAWDLCDQKDFRIKMCTRINMEDFVVIHHEMGHIQYFLQYKDEPLMFRNGANPGFHEAIGDTIALSVTTPKHLKKIGLITDYVNSKEAEINALMDMALEKIAFLPFGLLVDKWRWDVFNGSIEQDQWNSHWWSYKEKYQRLKAPISRSDEKDFDPGSKFHVAADSQYISYFVSHVLQFQLYKSLCLAAGEYNIQQRTPLHECDFYKSKKAGAKLRAGLSLGSSKHWSEALQAMTGEKELNAGPLLEYFQPLFNYLVEENEKYIEKSEANDTN